MRTAQTAARLRKATGDARDQDRTYVRLVERLGDATFWRAAGITAGMDYGQFRTRVTPRTYQQLAPALERMKRGEPDVLWPGRCTMFAASAGTTSGQPKIVAMTEELLAHFRQAGRDALLYYTARIGHAGVFRGRHLLLGGSTALQPLAEAKPHDAYMGDVTGITALNLPRWVERHLYEPGAAIAQMADSPEKLQSVIDRCRHRDISLIAGIPNWVLLFAEALRKNASQAKQRVTNLQALWPNLECFLFGGVPLGPFYDDLRRVLGAGVNFHEIYAAAEGIIAAQDAGPTAGLRLMTGGGLFFEFIPLAEYDESRIDQLGPKAVLLAEAKVGVDYVLLVTTPGGLARYVLGDIVRFVSLDPPRLTFIGRTALQLSQFGERVAERDLTEALLAVCRRHGWTIVNFHVAPLPSASNLTGHGRGRHEWWIELRPGTVATPIGPPMAAELDSELQRLNESYAARRKVNAIELPTVRLVMPGVFEHWLRFHGRWGGQNKLPRSRNDRSVATELAQVTNFAQD